MPAYDSERYLGEAIDSILRQSFADLELIIISEHGTSDNTITTIESYSDERIRHIHNTSRLGLVGSLNVGLKRAKGEYVARMDADDISLPDRIRKQVQLLDQQPLVGILGTWYEVIDEAGRVVARSRPPPDPVLTRWLLLFVDAHAIGHPTAMVRRSVYEKLGGYRFEALHAEDYDLWVRAVRMTEIANLAETLVKVRRHGRQVSRLYTRTQLQNATAISESAVTAALGKNLRRQVLRAVVQPRRVTRARDAYEAAKATQALCMRYIASQPMSVREARSVRDDAARRCYGLALRSALRNPLLSVMIYSMIARLSGRESVWFLPLAMQRAGNRLGKSMFRTARALARRGIDKSEPC